MIEQQLNDLELQLKNINYHLSEILKLLNEFRNGMRRGFEKILEKEG